MNKFLFFLCLHMQLLLFLLNGLWHDPQGLFFYLIFSPHLVDEGKWENSWVGVQQPAKVNPLHLLKCYYYSPSDFYGLVFPWTSPSFSKIALVNKFFSSPLSTSLKISQCSTSACLLLFLYMPVLGSFMLKYKFSYPLQTKKLPIYFFLKVKILVHLINIFSWCQVWADNWLCYIVLKFLPQGPATSTPLWHSHWEHNSQP